MTLERLNSAPAWERPSLADTIGDLYHVDYDRLRLLESLGEDQVLTKQGLDDLIALQILNTEITCPPSFYAPIILKDFIRFSDKRINHFTERGEDLPFSLWERYRLIAEMYTGALVYESSFDRSHMVIKKSEPKSLEEISNNNNPKERIEAASNDRQLLRDKHAINKLMLASRGDFFPFYFP